MQETVCVSSCFHEIHQYSESTGAWGHLPDNKSIYIRSIHEVSYHFLCVVIFVLPPLLFFCCQSAICPKCTVYNFYNHTVFPFTNSQKYLYCYFFSVHRYYTIKYVLLLFVFVVVCTVTFEKPLINDNVDDYEKIQNIMFERAIHAMLELLNI